MTSILLALLLVLASSANPCTPKFLLSSTIHDAVSMYSFDASNGLTKSNYTYNYFQSLFAGQPKAIISINHLITSQISELNYQLTAQPQTDSLIFSFTSKNMNWISVQLQFLLHSRNDLYSNVETISITEVGTKNAVNFNTPKQNNPTNDASYIFSHFIIGVVAATNQYEISLQSQSVSSNQYSIIASANVQATLTVQTVYFSSLQTSFSYAINQFSINGMQQPQYRTLWADFAPTIYTLFGFSTIKGSGNAFSIVADLDLVNNILTIGNMTGMASAKLNYFAIGVLPSDVCSPCNNFISISGCLDVCPNNSYAQNLNGGKTCRLCNSNLGQSLNTASNTCTCPNGQIFDKGNCFNQAELPPTCTNNQILINNMCVSTASNNKCSSSNQYYNTTTSSCLCVPNYERIQGECVQSCPQNSKRDANTGICICSAGFLMNALNKCVSICPSNSAFDTKSAACVCFANFQMVSGACKACNQNQAYDASSKTCVAKLVGKVGIAGSTVTIICQPNEIIVNNACQCDDSSVKIGGKCTACPSSTYKVVGANQCGLCSSYCKTCQSNASCTECNTGFQIYSQHCEQICGDGRKFILPCDDGNTKNGDGCSSTCQIESGYVCNGGNARHPDKCTKLKVNTKISISITPDSPTFTTPGIVTDFIVQPPIRRSHQELHKLFLITFSNNRARPMHIRLSQSDTDLTSVRCFFSYNSNLPNDIFQVTFLVQDENYGQDSITIMYNSLTNPVKSAIAFLEGQEDVLTN